MNDEVTLWLQRLTEGDADAVGQVWQHFSAKMLYYARKRLGGTARRAADEEDVALSAFHSVCQGFKQGQFPDLDGRDALWKLLTTVIARKAAAQLRHGRRKKRGGGRVRGESIFLQPDTSNDPGLGNIAGSDPTPAFAAEMVEQCSRLLDSLPDDCRRVALLKLDGYSNEEIAERLELAPRTIERKLAAIRSIWKKDSGDVGQVANLP